MHLTERSATIGCPEVNACLALRSAQRRVTFSKIIYSPRADCYVSEQDHDNFEKMQKVQHLWSVATTPTASHFPSLIPDEQRSERIITRPLMNDRLVSSWQEPVRLPLEEHNRLVLRTLPSTLCEWSKTKFLRNNGIHWKHCVDYCGFIWKVKI